jgi:uncharacterized membrane protein YphA (DoxX/SURF4 family)
MTTRSSSAALATPPLQIDRSRLATAGLWLVQLAVAGMFLFAGSLKLVGDPQMVATFGTIGLGQWFRYLTGGIEVVSALALLVPSLAPFGALALVPTMIGAIITHLFILGGPPTPAAILLIGALVILWGRRRELARGLASLR